MNTPNPQTKTTTCRSCGAVVAFGKTKTGKTCPFNVVDGVITDESHFRTCPQARTWSHR